jgi:hypothetical protein
LQPLPGRWKGPITPLGEKKAKYANLSVVSLRTCRVSCEDLEGIEHSVEVTAESLYEAVARGLRAFHASPWVGEIGGGLTTVTVELREPVPEKAEVKHQVRMKNFRQWLDIRGTTPAQITAKDRVREILGGMAVEPTDRQKRRRWAEERNR